MKEKNFQTLFGQHLKIANSKTPCVFELKIIKNNKPFAFNQVKEHQIAGLRQAKLGQYIKLQDMSSMAGFANPKPYDCLWVKVPASFVALFFYHPRKEKFFYLIEIEDFVDLRDNWKRKSIRESELDKLSVAIKHKLKTKKIYRASHL